MTTQATLEETIGRQTVIALAHQYGSVSEALLELTDNPFDYRYGRHLSVQVELKRRQDVLRVIDYGGEGMDAEQLAQWIRWGEGTAHQSTDIGQYRVGGKLAAIYLGSGIDIVCRKAGQSKIWRFNDPQWGTRTSNFFGQVMELTPHDAAWLVPELEKLGDSVGFTSVVVNGLHKRRYDVATLKEKIGDTYRQLIDTG